MQYTRLILQYDGTGYAGFQWQKDAPSIQAELNATLGRFLRGKFSTVGASRTDSGVHAHHQVVRITSEDSIDCERLLRFLKTTLPPQIQCLSVTPTHGEFNPSAQARSKEYRYLFTNRTHTTEAERRFVANIANPLSIEKIQRCVAFLNGTHDFCNFVSMGSNVKTTHRTLLTVDLSVTDPHTVLTNAALFPLPASLTSCYQLRIEAQGFLKQMIRHLVAALWLVGSEKISGEDFRQLLQGPRRAKRLWKVADPRGLHLWRIEY